MTKESGFTSGLQEKRDEGSWSREWEEFQMLNCKRTALNLPAERIKYAFLGLTPEPWPQGVLWPPGSSSIRIICVAARG